MKKLPDGRLRVTEAELRKLAGVDSWKPAILGFVIGVTPGLIILLRACV